MRFDQGADLGPRHQAFHARQKLRLARRPVVLLESSGRCQRHLRHCLVPCYHNSLSDSMTAVPQRSHRDHVPQAVRKIQTDADLVASIEDLRRRQQRAKNFTWRTMSYYPPAVACDGIRRSRIKHCRAESQ